jgi:hypothetical protein
MAGSDGPTPIGQRGLEKFVLQAARGDRAVAEQILARTAVRFFGLGEIAARHQAA